MATIKLSNISVDRQYKGLFNKKTNGNRNLLVIKNSIELNSGDIVFVSGENGSGKSVFLNLLSRNIGDFFSNYRNLVINSINKAQSSEFHYSFPVKNDNTKLTKIPLMFSSGSIHNQYKNNIVHFESDNKENKFYFLSTIKKQFLISFKNRELNQSSEKNINEKTNQLIFGMGLTHPDESYLYKMAKVIYRTPKVEKKEYLKQIENKLLQNLSSGQKQMFAFFESLAQIEVLGKEIAVAIFDEPLNYLDGINRDKVIEEINRITTLDSCKHLITIIVSHCTLFDFLIPNTPQYARLKRIHISKQGEVSIINKDDPNIYQCGHCHQRRNNS